MTAAPLTPPDADLQDFPFMPLHVARLRDSDLAAEGHPEGCWYAVLLWAASWHQLPAGSLPDNDAVLARLCNLGRDVRTFARRRDDALRGWSGCSDGRLYHPVVAEQVIAAWRSKVEQRHRTECARIKKHNQRYQEQPDMLLTAPALPEFMSQQFPASVPFLSPGTIADVPRDNDSKREGQGERQGQGDNNPDAGASGGVTGARGRRLDFDWEPGPLPAAVASLVAQWPPDREQRELDGFRDFWTSRAGRDAAKLDWDKTWHNRIRDQHDRIMRDHRNGTGTGHQPGSHGLGPVARALVEREAERAGQPG